MESIKKLRDICQHENRLAENHLVAVWIFRSFSIYFTRLLLLTSISANQITVWATIVVILSPFLFLTGNYIWTVIGVVLYLIAYTLDYSDGEVARYRKTDNKMGLWFFEPATHDVQYGLVTIPMGLAAYLMNGSIWMLILGFAGSQAKLITRALENRFEKMQLLRNKNMSHGEKLKNTSTNQNIKIKLYAIIYNNIYSTAGFCFTVPLAALFERYDIFVWFYGVTLIIIFFIYLIRLYVKLQPFLKNA